MKILFHKYQLSKFHSIFNGLFFAILAIPFFILGLFIIIRYGTFSRMLWIPFLGLLFCLLSGLSSMLRRNVRRQKMLKLNGLQKP